MGKSKVLGNARTGSDGPTKEPGKKPCSDLKAQGVALSSDIVSFMMDPASYKDKTIKVEHKETHISHVFLTERFAYKIKKPVDFGFLDFTTLKKREFYCNEELRLNKRLCPDLYLGVVRITYSEKGLEVNGSGRAVEYAIKMRRMPDDAIMTQMVKEGKVNAGIISRIASIIAGFHMKNAQENKPVIGKKPMAWFGREAVREAVEQNFSQTEKYIGVLIDRKKYDFIRDAAHEFLEKRKEMFDARIKEGRIIEYHGDLHTGNIFISNRDIQIFDCIEFNESFRCGDAVNDVAFLAMDLDFLGKESLSKHFIKKYVEFTGDYTVYSLLNFYKCYRAYVRAKVTSFMYDDPNNTDAKKDELMSTARKYYWLAFEYAQHLNAKRPLLMISCGVSGTGKSRWLKFASDIAGGMLFRTDAVRKKLFSLTGKEAKDDEYRKRYYNDKSMQKVYDFIFDKAEQILEHGGNVAIDASFIKKSNRDAARDIANRHDADFVVIYTTCREETAKNRIHKRMQDKSNISDADFEHAYLYQTNNIEAPGKDENVIHINTDMDSEANLKSLKKNLDKKLNIRI